MITCDDGKDGLVGTRFQSSTIDAHRLLDCDVKECDEVQGAL